MARREKNSYSLGYSCFSDDNFYYQQTFNEPDQRPSPNSIRNAFTLPAPLWRLKIIQLLLGAVPPPQLEENLFTLAVNLLNLTCSFSHL